MTVDNINLPAGSEAPKGGTAAPATSSQNIALENQDGVSALEGPADNGTSVIGVDDRAAYLAMNYCIAPILSEQPDPKPDARFEGACTVGGRVRIGGDNRCGRNGFCDPSSDMGCGGEYCGRTC